DFSTANDLFKIGIVKNGNKPIGFLRIHTFVSAQYPTVCAEEWNSFRSSISGACYDACQDVFMRDHLENRLLSELAKTLERLRAQNIGALILDLTHNGGGSSWEEGVREMLTSKNLTCGQTGFIRHPQWVQHFESKIFWKWRQRGSGNGA
ncbi:MAG: S41 family peptidase, partial [Proteobacteria bacterium]|nr:S41 family peptidase [Pseudomonadota bacterium]